MAGLSEDAISGALREITEDRLEPTTAEYIVGTSKCKPAPRDWQNCSYLCERSGTVFFARIEICVHVDVVVSALDGPFLRNAPGRVAH